MSNDDLRERFEKWAVENAVNLCLRRHSDRPYWYADTLQVWEAVQAMQSEAVGEDSRDVLINAGGSLANCAFNLAQCERLNAGERRSLDESRKSWDAAIVAMGRNSDG